ncbi:unnamed protein product [Candida verbasci]|uniref:Glutathione synthetase n=1 Tax=Candida verbasci TaxID=1227364 RepID=A0A9W4TUY8_9ASCO|nr:unnamed protein product [Candida verbasci]
MSTHKLFPRLNKEQEDELISNVQQWSLSNGLVMYPPNFEIFQVNVAPITIYPTPISKKSFDKAMDLQTTYNELYINLISQHKKYLISILSELSKFDPNFTGKLFEIYDKVKNNKQNLSLGIFRSDYMIDQKKDEIKQIEFNTVSVSFGGLSNKVSQLHKYLNDSGQYTEYKTKYYEESELEISSSIREIAQGLAEGDKYYNGSKKNTILFIVQPNERNCFDQRHIEYELFHSHGLKSIRVALDEVKEKLTIYDSKLYLKSTMQEISVIYYRSGYSPDDYKNEENWDNRLYLEESHAIKCPSILTQLSGSKKIQQLLTNPEILEKILPDNNLPLLSTFVSIYPLDNSNLGEKGKELAFSNPNAFVLKPQREGGGNNIYKSEIPKFLKSIDEKDWAGYILMELIYPQSFQNKILRNGDLYNESIISELGIFGTIIFDENTGDIKSNKNAGWLLRSKFETSDEGGVAAGFGCVDNIYLY